MKIILPIVLFNMLIVFTANAQSIERSLISASGGYFETENQSLTWALGDLLTETFSTDNLYLTQGFLQPETLKTDIVNQKANGLKLNVYPNPATDIFVIEFTSEEAASFYSKYQLSIIDMGGKVIQKEQLIQERSSISIQNLQPGTYLIQVTQAAIAFKSTLILQKK